MALKHISISTFHRHVDDQQTYVMISLLHYITKGSAFQKNDGLEVAEIGTREDMRVGSRSENVNKNDNETATTQERKVHAIYSGMP